MVQDAKDLIMDRIFQCGVKRRRSLLLIILIIITVVAIYIFNSYLYSYENNYRLTQSQLFVDDVDIKGITGVKMPVQVIFTVEGRADLYIFEEKTYDKYYNEPDFPESYQTDAIAYNLDAKKIELNTARCPGKLYVVAQMPEKTPDSNPVIGKLFVKYKPLDPIYPISLLISVILIPLLFLRIYTLGRKAMNYRMQLSLDLDNLSDEDRIRLGIPPKGVREEIPPPEPIAQSPPLSTPPVEMPPPPIEGYEKEVEMEEDKKGRRRYISPDEV